MLVCGNCEWEGNHEARGPRRLMLSFNFARKQDEAQSMKPAGFKDQQMASLVSPQKQLSVQLTRKTIMSFHSEAVKVPMIPLGLKETKDVDFTIPIQVRGKTKLLFTPYFIHSLIKSVQTKTPGFSLDCNCLCLIRDMQL